MLIYYKIFTKSFRTLRNNFAKSVMMWYTIQVSDDLISDLKENNFKNGILSKTKPHTNLFSYAREMEV